MGKTRVNYVIGCVLLCLVLSISTMDNRPDNRLEKEAGDNKAAGGGQFHKKNLGEPALAQWARKRQWEKFMAAMQKRPKEVPYWDGSDFVVKLSSTEKFKVRKGPTVGFGSPWPLPQYYTTSTTVYQVEKKLFKFRALKHDCDILQDAFRRYKATIFDDLGVSVAPVVELNRHLQTQGLVEVIQMVDVAVFKPCTTYPTLESDESYSLHISEKGAFISANETWGALRGLATFSQLIYYTTDGNFYVNRTVIKDFPRWRHRGVLVDTARHFMRKETLLLHMDAMELNKINVFHWHMVDDQSFPFQSKVFPKLSAKGAFDAESVYTLEDVSDIIEYGRLRGIRVIPEFDTPGHVHSWGYGHPEFLTPCYVGNEPDGFYGPIHPLQNTTYNFLEKLFGEILTVFKDRYVHLGGDEVSLGCWYSNPDIMKYIQKTSPGNNEIMVQYYTQRLINIILKLGQSRAQKAGNIVWQEVFDKAVELNPDTIVQVWMGSSADVERVTQQKMRAIFSSCWYLDHFSYGIEWQRFYLCDPLNEGRAIDTKLFLGAEFAMWAEYIDDSEFLSRTWPRGSAAAERFWSNQNVRDIQSAAYRLEEQRCRMANRGISMGVVNGPTKCPSNGKKRESKIKIVHLKEPCLQSISASSNMNSDSSYRLERLLSSAKARSYSPSFIPSIVLLITLAGTVSIILYIVLRKPQGGVFTVVYGLVGSQRPRRAFMFVVSVLFLYCLFEFFHEDSSLRTTAA
ncbi:beta-hexosaminidase subunit alpha-like [Tubulanus polymorphus]|uniref:beta-hexosaminidase subunit alpha-like n=1 Tax=Tubulanus polymorphus TaxID=672921 RepID=UPI003DA6613E